MDQDTQRKLDDINKKLDYVLLALPTDSNGNPDPLAHRHYHEEENQYLRDRRKFREALKAAVASGAVWSIVMFMLSSIWFYVKYLVLSKGD